MTKNKSAFMSILIKIRRSPFLGILTKRSIGFGTVVEHTKKGETYMSHVQFLELKNQNLTLGFCRIG